MEAFKKDIDEQHAPQALIESTVRKIHKAEERKSGFENVEYIEKDMISGKKVAFTGFGVVAACLVLAVVFSIGQPKLIYNEMTAFVERSSQEREDFVEISLEEYEQYINADFSEQLADYEIERSDIMVRYDKDGRKIEEDEAVLYMKMNGQVMILKISKNNTVAPKELTSGEPSDIDGINIYLGMIEDTNQLVAAFQRENVNYYLICRDMSKKSFEKNIKKFIK